MNISRLALYLSTYLIIGYQLVSCNSSPETPGEVAQECLNCLAAKDLDKAEEFFARRTHQKKWFERYYKNQPIERLFDGTIKNTHINGNQAVVTYTPKETLFNAFDKDDLILLTKEQNKWMVDIENASMLKNRINGGGTKTDLGMLGDYVSEAAKKLGRTPTNMDEIFDNLELESARKYKKNYDRNLHYYPAGKLVDGIEGVIFHSKKPDQYGMFYGATKDRFFLSGNGKLIIECRLSLF